VYIRLVYKHQYLLRSSALGRKQKRKMEITANKSRAHINVLPVFAADITILYSHTHTHTLVNVVNKLLCFSVLFFFCGGGSVGGFLISYKVHWRNCCRMRRTLKRINWISYIYIYVEPIKYFLGNWLQSLSTAG
jgi:hypothetical protein